MISFKGIFPEFIKGPIRSHLHEMRVSRSQAGQDIWVIGEVFDGKREGFFLDVGAYDGVELSNSYILEKNYDWRGICIEANSDIFTKLKRNRSAKCVNACLDSSEGEQHFREHEMFSYIAVNSGEPTIHDQSELVKVTTTTLERVLIDCTAPSEIDYLSLDIEGAEERVLAGFPFEKYRFNCMTIERPTPTLRELLSSEGYVLIKEIPGLDCFYLHSDLQDQYLQNVFSFWQKKYLVYRMG